MEQVCAKDNNSGRCEWKDVTSAVVIFLIWVAHLGSYNVGLIRPYIGWFANPIFFMISGFYAESGKKYKYSEFLMRNIKRLLVPYFGWAVINVIFFLFHRNIEDASEIYQGLWQYIECDLTKFRYGGTLWFLIGLFVCKIVYEALRRIFKDVRLVSLVCLIITIIMTIFVVEKYPVLTYGYSRGLYWMFFYSLGPIVFPVFNCLAKNIQSAWDGVKQKDRLSYWSVMWLFLLVAVYVYFSKAEIVYHITNAYIREIVIQIVMPLILTVTTVVLSLYIKSNTLANIGRNTLILCGTETIIKNVLPMFSGMFGLNFVPRNGIECLLFIVICFVLANKYLFPVINKCFPALAGKMK